MTILHLDFETRSTVDLKKEGLDVYANHPSTEVLCVGYAYGEGPVHLATKSQLEMGLDPIRYIKPDTVVVCHNASFELAIWNNVCVPKYRWPALDPKQVVCTMAMAYAMALPASLANVAPALGLDIKKDDSGQRVMMQLSRPRKIGPEACTNCEGRGVEDLFMYGISIQGRCLDCYGTGLLITWWEDPAKLEKLYAYCMQDVEVERQVHKRLMDLSPHEKEIWQLDYRINQRGIQVDVEAARVAMELVEKEKEYLDEQMHVITGGQVEACTAAKQLTEWLKSKGLELEGVAKSDVTELLGELDLPPGVREVLMLRQQAAKSSTAKLGAMLARVGRDGRLRYTTQYHAASTGRWGGRGVQVHNLPRPRISQEEIDGVFNLLRGKQ